MRASFLSSSHSNRLLLPRSAGRNEHPTNSSLPVSVKQDPLEAGNVVGKRVMKTQDGKPLSDANRDFDTMADLGVLPRYLVLRVLPYPWRAGQGRNRIISIKERERENAEADATHS